MICQNCHQREANVFLTEIVQGETTHSHLCEPCARERGAAAGFAGAALNPFAALGEFFSSFFQIPPEAVAGVSSAEPPRSAPGAVAGAQCPHCGYQFEAFQRTGRLGCTRCYESFAELLRPVLQGLHGGARHVEESSAAPPAPAAWEGDPEEARLRSELDRAVREERFEDAVRLRDALRRRKHNRKS